MASVRDIARQVGVSPATVSRAINNHPRVAQEVRDRVLAAVNDAGYVPAVGRRSTTNIAFAYTGDSSLGSPFDAGLMQGMSERMDEFGFDLLILNVTRALLPHETCTQMFVRKGVRGAVLRTTDATRYLCEQIADEHFPAVVLGERFDHPRISYIYSASKTASRDAVEHLINLGHRRIAITINIVDDSDHADRVAGYQQALSEYGLTFDPRLVLRTVARLDGGEQLIRRLITMPDRPTAIYITDPMAAVGAMNEARAQGLDIPRDLSIVGFDDADMRRCVYPKMTSVCQDAAEMGRRAFAALNRVLESTEPRPLVHEALRTWFEVHGSTGPPPG